MSSHHHLEIDGIGIIAGLLTTSSPVPQIIQSYKKRSCSGLSWGLILMNFTGVFMWTVYGVITHNNLIIIYDVISCVQMMCLAFMKYKFRQRQSIEKQDESSIELLAYDVEQPAPPTTLHNSYEI